MKKVKKRDESVLLISLLVVICFVLLINVISTAMADLSQDEQDKVPLAYKWLTNHTKGKLWNTLTTKQSAFSLLALSCNSTYVSQGNKSLYNASYYNSTQKIRCWGEKGKVSNSQDCKITETALAKMALDEVGGNTTYVDNWILKQNRTFFTGIYWFLEIDVARGKKADCEIMYGDVMQNVTIYGNKTVSINGQGCIKKVFKNYWFQLEQSAYCHNQEYTIKCFGNESVAEPVLSTLLYKNNSDEKDPVNFFVSSEISTGTLGYINEVGEEEPTPGVMMLNVPSYCLADPRDPRGECDYEGTAWATYVWQRQGKSEYANMFIPYLVVYSEFYEKYFPESFLSSLIGGGYTEQLIREQQRLRKPQSRDYYSFWLNQPLWYGQFYDTPKAVLALGENTPNITEVKDYLLAHLSNDYSWINNFDAADYKDIHRDTAFILWVFWKSYCPGAGSYGENACESQGIDFFCKEGDTCTSGVEFGPYDTLNCPDGTVCCKKLNINPDACTEAGGTCMNGTSCPSDYGYLENVWTCPTESPLCCKQFSTSGCYDWGGSVCYAGESCLENKTVQTIEGECCLSSCSSGNAGDSCFSLGGAVCGSGQICWSYILQQDIGFIQALEGNCCTADCVDDSTCSVKGGKDCATDFGIDYQCVDSLGSPGNLIKTKDLSECCMDDCLRTCDSSKICDSGACKQIDTSAIAPANGVCCMTECSSKKNYTWLIILLIVLIIAVLVYFFVFKKKKKDKEENVDEFSDFSQPTKPTKKSEMSLFGKKDEDLKEEPGEEPFSDIPEEMKPEKEEQVKTKAPAKKKAKSKAEEELEDTLGKLKKMTKE